MLVKTPIGYVNAGNIIRVTEREEGVSSVMIAGQEEFLRYEIPADVLASRAGPAIPAQPGYVILRDTGYGERHARLTADPVVAWRIGSTKAYPVGLIDSDRAKAAYVGLQRPDGAIVTDDDRLLDTVEAWLALNDRRKSGDLG